METLCENAPGCQNENRQASKMDQISEFH